MERVAGDVEGGHLSVADIDALLIGALVEHARDLEAGLGRGGTDQLHYGEPVCQRAATPVLRDVAEQAVLDPVPFRRAWRISRSGCLEPSSALRLCCREKPSFASSLATVSALIGWPIAVRASASLSMLLETHRSGRSGSPSVAGSTRLCSAGSKPGSRSLTAFRPPPARRAYRPSGSGPASISSSPRLIVERASPVIRDTTASPPQPAVRTSAAANRRRPRSSR